MFIDRAQIEIKAGNGGDGITSFLHYKGVVNGGPDGGDGGKEAAANPKTCSARREKISS